MPFRSRKQWRWAFANNKGFARSWARKNKRSGGGYRKLPSRRRKKG